MIQQSMSLKVFIIPLALAVSVAIAIFFIKPAFSDMMSLKNTLDTEKIQLDNLKSQNQKLQSVKSKWDAMTDEKTLVASAIPEQSNIDSLISELSSKASRSGILLSSIDLSQNTGASGASGAQEPAYVCSAASAVVPTQIAPSPGVPQPPDALGANAGVATEASSCLETAEISMKAKGSWQQMLDFFKYLEDMNRISNIKTADISSVVQAQDQSSSDLLSVSITIDAFSMEKNKNGNATLAGSLASQGNFNQSALARLKATIYAPYDVPAVSPGGDRNIFQ